MLFLQVPDTIRGSPVIFASLRLTVKSEKYVTSRKQTNKQTNLFSK